MSNIQRINGGGENKMTQMEKLLQDVNKYLAQIPVKGDAVDFMCVAREKLRQAMDLARGEAK
ncbi:MAG: hypothetical protein LUF80_00650 [Oscillospiraceae bacterium]|nr:hypothetical protein [Oscillospiraceae bacterium]